MWIRCCNPELSKLLDRAIGQEWTSDLSKLKELDLFFNKQVERLFDARKELNDKALIWLKKVEKHYGRKPVVYTPDSYAKDILSDEIKNNYPIWVAHYGVAAPNYKDWKMWQFTDKAVVHGIKGKVDLSVVR